jgi:hypothetical protein
MPAPASATAVAVPVTRIARTSLRTRGRRCCLLLAMPLTPASLHEPDCLWCGVEAQASAACLLLLHAGAGAACMCMCRWRWRPPTWSSAAACIISWWEPRKAAPAAAMDKRWGVCSRDTSMLAAGSTPAPELLAGCCCSTAKTSSASNTCIPAAVLGQVLSKGTNGEKTDLVGAERTGSAAKQVVRMRHRCKH